MEEEFYKDFPKVTPKKAPKEALSQPFRAPIPPLPEGNITQDFKTATKVIKHVRKLSDEEKKSFAHRYDISYDDVSEIPTRARQKFWDS
jgi:hypothetical protein|tara:strand:- start:236 stop:502 length:267 start_codon:yes stop_codon:yes gene_type:complete